MTKTDTIKVTIFYPNAEGATFDHGYYADTHMPMIAERLGKALTDYGIDQGLAGSAADEPAPLVTFILILWPIFKALLGHMLRQYVKMCLTTLTSNPRCKSAMSFVETVDS